MKLRAALLLLVLLGGCGVRPHGLVGGQGTDVGGAHEKLRESSAWFRGRNDKVRVCVEGPEAVRWSERIYAAFKVWASYFDAKQVDTESALSRQARRRADVRSTCLGDEELVFRIGSTVPDVARAPGREVFGFAWRETDRSYVWLEPDASDSSLLHEWGHVFGVGHVPGTVMAASPSGDILDPATPWPIDGVRELFVRPDGTYASEPIPEGSLRRQIEALFGGAVDDEAPRLWVKRDPRGGWSEIGLDAGGTTVRAELPFATVPVKKRGLDDRHGDVGCRRYRLKTVVATFWEGLESHRPGETVSLEIEGLGGESVVIPLRFVYDRGH